MRCPLLLLSACFLACFFSCASCTGQSKDGIVWQFLNGLKANDQQKIYEISYHVDSKSNFIVNDDVRKHEVALASDLLNRYTVSPRNRWTTEQFPGGATELSIPLVAGSDTAVRATIFLHFPPPSVSDKVYNFMALVDPADGPKVLTAPPRTNP